MLSKLFRRKAASSYRLVIEPDGHTLEMRSGESLLQAALAAGIPFPYSCKVGTCTSCKCRLLEGQVRAVRDFSYVLSGEELRDNWILACQSVPKGDVRIHLAHERSGPAYVIKTIPGRVASTAALARDVLEVRVALDQPILYEAGQYADLEIPEIPRPRSYSFADAPLEAGRKEVAFHVRLIPGGEVSGWLTARDRAGERVRLVGPYGTFWLRDAASPILCVAGGTGMAPIRAILEKACREGPTRDVVYLYGARTRKHLYGLEEMKRIGQSWRGSFRFVPVLSDEPPDTDWSGLRGFVTEHVRSAELDLAACHAYLCGPPRMIDAAMEVLDAAGTSPDAIHFDKFFDARDLSAREPGAGSGCRGENEEG